MQKIGIGYENYKRVIDDGCYFVDKTLLIRDILEKGGMVSLFTRPRRFGKTLALSMIRTFFEAEYDAGGTIIDKRHYFADKKIMQCDDKILSKMGRYPVISISIKSARQPDFRNSFFKLREEIIGEFDRHKYLAESEQLDAKDRETFNKILNGEVIWDKKTERICSDEEQKKIFTEECGKYASSLKTLSTLLQKHHGKKTIILVDEYDVPLENAYYNGFYNDMVDFIRSLLESALKTNDALEFAIVTGCLRISKESIFTGLNNFTVNSIRSSGFSEYFGFTNEETYDMLKQFRLEDKMETVKEWYDGYLFGRCEVYNPWSVTNYVYEHINDSERLPEPYWSNTSSNAIIKDMVANADKNTKEEINLLINGGVVEKKVHENITYDDIHSEKDNLWNFLFFTGYMRKTAERAVGDDVFVEMCIPNRELRSIYKNQVSLWFEDLVKHSEQNVFHNAVLNRDAETMGKFLSELMEKSISTFDSSEGFYNGLVLSLLYGVPHYTPKSNRESGNGRPDIVLYPDRPKDPAFVFEFKVRKKFNEMDDGLSEALNQIKEKNYAEGVLNDGYNGCISYGICFCKKSCVVGVID